MRISDWSSDVCSSDLVSEAHVLRRKIASHAEGLLGARASIAAGVDSIEHGFDLDEAACAAMKEKGIFLVATLALLDRVVNTPGVPEYARQKAERSEEHTSELQSLMRISYAVFCLKKKNNE